jgi:hypothetical protein
VQLVRRRLTPLSGHLSAQEDEAHRALAASLGKAPIWQRYLSEQT